MKEWNKPCIIDLSNNRIKTGAPGAYAYEFYVNLGSMTFYPCGIETTMCADGRTLSGFTTTSFYNTTVGAPVAACNQTNGVTAPPALGVCS